MQLALSLPLATLTGLQWVVWLAVVNNVLSHWGGSVPWAVGWTGGWSPWASSCSSRRSDA